MFNLHSTVTTFATRKKMYYLTDKLDFQCNNPAKCRRAKTFPFELMSWRKKKIVGMNYTRNILIQSRREYEPSFHLVTSKRDFGDPFHFSSVFPSLVPAPFFTLL